MKSDFVVFCAKLSVNTHHPVDPGIMKRRTIMEKQRLRNIFLFRIIAAAAAAAIMLLMLPGGITKASAQTSTTIYDGDFGYILDVDKDKGIFTATICEYRPADRTVAQYDVSIPDTISPVKYPVTAISANAFSNFSERNKIKSVKLPKSITTIGDHAFRDLINAEKIDLPSDLQKIGSYSFAGCSSLKEVKIGDKVKEIGYSAFYNCISLEKVTLPKSLEYIGQSSFSGCTSLYNVDIPDTVKSIGTSAFEGCSKLEKIKLPKELTEIDDYTFHNCKSLLSVTLPDTLKTIGVSSFADCTSLTSINIPESVTQIGTMAFSGCFKLSAVVLPYGLGNISDNAFFNTSTEIWGYTNSYAENYAYRNGLRFHSNGSVCKVTFSADNMNATVNNIAIRSSKGVLVIPPATATKGEQLTINVTAPINYDINYITINNESFANGGTYTVTDADVNIFVSYKSKEATTTTTAAPPVSVTTSEANNTPASASSSGNNPAYDDDPHDDPDDDDDDDADTTVTVDNNDTNEDDGNSEDSYVKVDSDLTDINGVKVRIISQRENFIGPATVRITNTQEASDAAAAAAESLDVSNAMYYAFDISIYDRSGKENQGVLAKGTITFQIPIPNGLLPYAKNISVYHIVDERPEFIRSSVIEDINGVRKIQFETDNFSPYMFLVTTDDSTGAIPVIDEDGDDPDTTQSAQPSAGVIDNGNNNNNGGNNNTPDASIIDTTKPSNNNYPNYNGNVNPHTGAIIAGATAAGGALVCIALVRRRSVKRKRTKTPID